MYGATDLLAGRNNEAFTKLNGKRKAFFKGSNSTCHFHIHQHYEVYKEKCEKGDILMCHWAIPRPIWKAMEEEKEEQERGRSTKKQMQHKLDFKTMMGPCEFTRSGVLHAVVKLIVTNNQVCC